jgi:hypothetical protein
MLVQKRWMLILSLLGTLLVFAGCSNTTNTDTNDGPSPDLVVKTFFDDLQKGNINQASSLLQKQADKKGLEELTTNPEGNKIATLYLEHLNYEIGSPDINGDKAAVPVKVTVPSTSKMAGSVVKEAVSGALSGKTDLQMEKKGLQAIEGAIKDPSTPKSTYNSEIKLVKTEEGWKIKSVDMGFINAVGGALHF